MTGEKLSVMHTQAVSDVEGGKTLDNKPGSVHNVDPTKFVDERLRVATDMERVEKTIKDSGLVSSSLKLESHNAA